MKWKSSDSLPVAGRLGFVLDGDRNLALFSVLESEGHTSTVQILDSIWPDVVRQDQEVRLSDDQLEAPSPDMAAYFIWSGHSGRPVSLDGVGAGKTPTRLILSPGSHEILVELPSGGKAGARVEARAGESEVLLLSGKIPAATDGMGPIYLRYRSDRWPRKPAKQIRHLLWLEDNEGAQVYLAVGPITAPVAKSKVNPKYPESARKAQVQGMVWLYALIGADGSPMQVRPISGPAPSLASAAVEAVSQWVYQPAMLDGKPVPALFPVAVQFYLTSSHP